MQSDVFLSSLEGFSMEEANNQIYARSGIVHFLPQSLPVDNTKYASDSREKKEEFGDWQTSYELAHAVCNLIKEHGFNPDVVVEPTCGKGAFILAALDVFESIKVIYGVELYQPYIDELKKNLLEICLNNNKPMPRIVLSHANVFDYDFSEIAKTHVNEKILVVGNPPWVTNSKLSSLNSSNLPKKTNFKQSKGLDAITGKGNFDIAEYISLMLMRVFSNNNGKFAFLVKNIVPKNIISEQKKAMLGISNVCQWNIDANKEFGVSASASLMTCDFGGQYSTRCAVYDFYTRNYLYDFGWSCNNFVSNIKEYIEAQDFDGVCPFEWWSGVKHDCSKVMELRKTSSGHLINGIGEIVDIEDDLVYPLLKSSSIGAERITQTSRFVIITQHTTSENTDYIQTKYPKAYAYLASHARELDSRKSVIYKKRPRFSIFGIGTYSFTPYKVAVSGLYKHTCFSLISPIYNKPVILDDTCYLIGFESEKFAQITLRILNGRYAQSLIHSIMFADAKRIINKDILMRLDIKSIIDRYSPESLAISPHDFLEYRDMLASSDLF